MDSSEISSLYNPSLLTSGVNNRNGETNRKRRRKRKRASTTHDKLELNPCDITSPDSDGEQPVSAPISERIVFDDDGNVVSTVVMEKRSQLSVSSRKNSKRSGVFYLRYGPGNDESNEFEPLEETVDSEFPTTQGVDVLTSYMTVVPLDRHMEVRLFRFPNDYESVVRYWYYNLDQLQRMENGFTFNETYDQSNLQDDRDGVDHQTTIEATIDKESVPNSVSNPTDHTEQSNAQNSCETTESDNGIAVDDASAESSSAADTVVTSTSALDKPES